MAAISPVRKLGTLAALLFVGTCSPALASHSVFSGSVDRFEIDGNVFGPADGTLDQVDEFDNGTLAPEFGPLLGTAVESGGVLTMKNPGVDIGLVEGVSLDISNVENLVDVENDAGDFVATSYWVPTLPAVNTGIHFELYGIGPTDIEAAGLTLGHNDADNAAGQNVPVGYSISQNVTFINETGVPQSDTIAFDAGDVTGPIVLRMAFDDDTDTLTCSFSFDGGTTFQSPFPPLHIFQAVDEHEILLGAAAVESTVPPPGEECVQISQARIGIRGLDRPPGQQSFVVTGKLPFPVGDPILNPVASGAVLALGDLPVGPLLWGPLVIPGGGPGSGCDPRDGWQLNGSYIYHNFSNAMPGCSPGSALGLTRIRIKDQRPTRGYIAFKAKGSNASVANPTAGARLVVALSAIDGTPCAETDLECRETTSAATCTWPP